jgi:hypothetical protein
LYVEFYSLDFTITQAINAPPRGCDGFRPHVVKYFVDHMDFYMAKLAWLKAKGDNQLISPPNGYTAPVVANYGATEAKLLALYKELTGKDWERTGDGGFDPRKRKW